MEAEIALRPRQLSSSSFGDAAQKLDEVGSSLFLDKSKALIRAHSEDRLHQRVPYGVLCIWVLFGASGWWGTNSIFAELPLLVHALPSGERLGNQLSMMTQFGSVFLVSYKAVEKSFSLNVGHVIECMMVAAVVSLACCFLFWDTVIYGRTFPLFAAAVVSGGVGCMSNATYWAFMVPYPAACAKAVSVGMSMGGMVSTGLAALQMSAASADHPRISTSAFFCVAAAMQVVFLLVVIGQQREFCQCFGLSPRNGGATPRANSLMVRCLSDQSTGSGKETYRRASRALNALNFIVLAMQYTMPTMLPYVAAAYSDSDVKQQLLLWMLTMQQTGETLGRLATPVGHSRRPVAIFAMTYFFAVYLFFLVACLHPDVVSQSISAWAAHIVLPALACGYSFSYGVIQTVIFLWARDCVSDLADAEKLSSDVGFHGQLGALSANLLTFAIINW
eukprot:TRINITY_DN22540_c0_g3_i1.p1 TRINITY_DN22540_c0_g3~~TRINITY_DN22540_c0_g3_i1.p1  ORF type:complete len:447 (-),score=50.20 TRINITY_DN22540_c0_g3_i1:315-1655(-)